MPARSNQTRRTLQETHTSLSPAEVVESAKEFFSRRSSIYAAYLEKEGPGFAAFRGQGGEEVVIGTSPAEGGRTLVTGSSYLFDQQVGRFLSTLPPFPAAVNDVEATA